MKRSQILVLLAVLAALVAGIILKTQQERPEVTREIYVSLTGFEPSGVDRVLIRKGMDPGEQIELVREGEGWSVRSLWSAPADAGKVEKFLDRIRRLKGEIRSSDETLFADYGIRETEAYHLELLSETDEPLAALLAGTVQPQPGEAFVRRRGSPGVFLTTLPVFPVIGIFGDPATKEPEAKYWMDTDFYKRSAEGVKEIKILRVKDGTETPVAKLILQPVSGFGEDGEQAGKKWIFAEPALPFEVDRDQVTTFLEAITDGRAVDVADPAGNYGFELESRKVILRYGEDDAVTVQLARQEGEPARYFIKMSGEEIVYEISTYSGKRISRPIHDFVKNHPLDFPAAGIDAVLLKHEEGEMFLGRTPDRAEVLDQIIETLGTLKARLNLWPDGREELPGEPPAYRLEAKSGEETVRILEFGKPSGAKEAYPLRVAGTEETFEVPAETFDRLFLPFTRE